MKLTILLLIFLFCLTFCNNESSKKVGFLLPDQSKERWQKDEAFFKLRAAELKLDVTYFDAKGDEELQHNQAIELIESGVKVIVIASVNANMAAAIVREAHKKNVQVIAYDRLIKNCDLDYYVSHNNILVGEEMAKYELAKHPKGNYMLLFGDRADNNAILVQQGIMNVLQPAINSGDVNIVFQSFVDKWKGNEAFILVDKFLSFSNDKLDVIIASGDGMADGVIESLEEYSLAGQVPITGQNADLIAIKNILQGRQSMTVYKPLKELAYAAADLTYQLLNKDKPSNIDFNINNSKINVPSILIPVQKVDKNNIDEVLIKSGFYKREEIYGN